MIVLLANYSQGELRKGETTINIKREGAVWRHYVKKGGKPCIEQSIKIYQLFNNDVTLYEMQLMIKQD